MDGWTRRLTIIDFLEQVAGTDFKTANRARFLIRTPAAAERVLDAYDAYLTATGADGESGDFSIPERDPRFSRPLIWHASSDAAGRVGADIYSREKPEVVTAQRMASALRDLLLLHHEIIITDQLQDILEPLARAGNDFPASQLSADLREDAIASYVGRYDKYIDFLLDIAELIRKGIVIVASDKTAYEIAPLDREARSALDGDETRQDASLSLEMEVAKRIAPGMRKWTEGLDPHDETRRLVPLSELRLHYDADAFLDNERDAVAYRLIQRSLSNMAGGGVRRSSGATVDRVLTRKLPLTAEKLTTQEIVDLRLNADTFEEWRQTSRMLR